LITRLMLAEWSRLVAQADLVGTDGGHLVVVRVQTNRVFCV
jgi:hypothetical protein